ncbi:MAG TPA: class I SAM-dependent methyltransferase [Marmoricola sp.]|nr:class I SAM-dependent methyltransferase [Marmoricola sp.]
MTIIEQRQDTPTLQEQAPRLLAHIAGYVGHRVVAVGLRQGLIRALADAEAAVSADDLAERLHLDPFYTAVWCRGAVASSICEVEVETQGTSLEARYRLGPHLDTLLLDTTHPSYAGGVFTVLEQHEVFDRFESVLASGDRLWWDGCSADWIAGVAGTGTPFYTRLLATGMGAVPGLAERLQAGARIVDTGCGSGLGLVQLARAYPECRIVGVDGDRHSVDVADRRLREAGVRDRCELVHSPLEEMVLDQPATCVVNNISMHECRDIDRVTERIHDALEPDGWFLISDFPYPDTLDALRSVPGRIMSGIQFFEAQIDDQLLPRAAYDDLLRRHGFTDVGHTVLAPVHALTYARRSR